jgi:hypothetical protein
MDLRGEWEFLAHDAEEPVALPAVGWTNVQVPGDMRQYTTAHHAWFGRNIEIPADWTGSVIRIYFGNICRRGIVYFNGTCVGRREGGRMPFWLDVTAQAKPGEANRLLVRVSDMTVYQLEPFSDRPDRIKLASWNPGSTGFNRFEGIVGEVCLQRYPTILIEDNFIQTSVRNSALAVEVTVRSYAKAAAGIKLSCSVWEGDGKVFDLPSEELQIEPGDTRLLQLHSAWAEPTLWYPNRPHLYTLRADIVDQNAGSLVDHRITEFGFREFRVGNREHGEDPAFFYLNGKICKLRCTEHSAYRCRGEDHSDPALREQVFMRDLLAEKEAHINMIRLFEPADTWHYERCNTAGMMVAPILTRCEPWQALHIGEKEFYRNRETFKQYSDNMVEYVRNWVRKARNNPSVVMWGLSNENLHLREYENELVEHLLRLEKAVKELDPTRPVYFSGDGDLFGQTDVVCLHNVRQLPGRSASLEQGILPNYAYFPELDDPRRFVTHRYFGLKGADQWRWNCDKPVYFAEWPYSLRSLCQQRAAPIYLGENAFRKPLWEHVMHASLIQMKAMIESARYLDFPSTGPFTVCGQSATPNPPTPISEGLKQILAPQMAAVKEWDSVFYAQSQVPRTITLFNDLYQKASLRLVWKFHLADIVIASGNLERSLDAGCCSNSVVELKMPDVKKRVEGFLELTLYAADNVVYRTKSKMSVLPRLEAEAPPVRIVVYDPLGKAELPYPSVKDLNEIDAGILIIAKNTAATLRDKSELLEYVGKGGKVLILQQEKAYDLLPVQIPEKSTLSSSLTFSSATGHPILRGLLPEDLKFWTGAGNERHVVSRRNLIRPILGNFRCLVVAGTGEGLNTTPLLEVPYGKGVIIASQMELTAKRGIAPQADILFANILAYLAAYQSQWRTVSIVADPVGDFVNVLQNLGVDLRNLNPDLTKLDPRHDIILLDGTRESLSCLVPVADSIKRFVSDGGSVYLWNLRQDASDLLRSVSGLQFRERQPGQEDYPLNRIADGALVYGITSQEVFWQRAQNDANVDPGEYLGGGHYVDPLYKDILEQGCSLQEGAEYISCGGLSQYQSGKGYFIVDQVNWVKGMKLSYKPLAMRYACTLFTNLGVPVSIARSTHGLVGISNWYRSEEGREVNPHYPLRYKMILDNLGIPYQILDGSVYDTAESRLDRFGMIVLMNGFDKPSRGSGLNPKEQVKIEEYVKNGGSVVLEGNAIVPRFLTGEPNEFPLAIPGEVTGIELVPGDCLPEELRSKFPAIMGTSRKLPTLKPGPGWQGEVLARWVVDGKPTDFPAILVGRYGKGRYAYISGEFYHRYEKIRARDQAAGDLFFQVVQHLIKYLAAPEATKTLNPENCVFADLAEYCNRAFKDEKPGDGKGGWTDQGNANDLGEIATGLQSFGGIPFQLIDPATNEGKSCLVMYSSVHAREMPDRVVIDMKNVRVDQLHFLHTAAWLDAPDGEEVFRYHLLFGDADGTTMVIPVRNKLEVADWYNYKPDLALSQTVNIPVNSGNQLRGIFAQTWRNPRPDLPLQRIEVIGTAKTAIPIILAITGSRDE